MTDPKNIKTISALEKEIGKILVVKDKGLIKTIVGAMVASRMSGDPVFLFIVGKISGGKSLGKGTPVRMYNGSIKDVEDIVVGDLFLGDDMKSRYVLSTVTGRGQMYSVSQDNGMDYVVNDAHILSLKNIEDGKVYDINIEDLLKMPTEEQGKYRGYRINPENPQDHIETNIVITKMYHDDYYGFEIDGNKRFVLGDFTVTHNTEYINMLSGLKFVRPLDTLTTNTFASGAPKRGGQQNSLLLKIQNGVLSIKDFTTILEMNETARKEIMSQLRVIFDGTFNKETGLGESIVWRGKISMIAAVTTVIHQRNAEYKSMGERFINYEFEQPTDEEVNKRMVDNAYDMSSKRKHMADCVSTYVNHVIDNMDDEKVLLPDDQFKILMDVSKYSTHARSGLECDPRDASRITFKPDKEGAGRLFGQLFALARSFIAIRQVEGDMKFTDGEEIKEGQHRLTAGEMEILVKIALCSIPRKRRDALKLLAKYKRGVSTGGVAVKLGYNTMVMRATMYELNALDFCRRRRDGAKDVWILDDSWRDLILEKEALTKEDDGSILEADEDGEEDYIEAEGDFGDKYRTGDAALDNF